jgi:hypothetical protein
MKSEKDPVFQRWHPLKMLTEPRIPCFSPGLFLLPVITAAPRRKQV